jgi:colanic acid/amylovoran biosynthesis glycosyltransferase
MSSLRIAVFVGTFPAVSETFIQRQIAGLLALGHEVDIYAETREDASVPVHADAKKYRLLERTTFMDMPPEVAPWELPVWPITGETWPPGSATSIRNYKRLAAALPKIARCFIKAPALTSRALSKREFGFQAESLSTLYRLDKLLTHKKRYDVLHAHFGPVGDSFRFAKELFNAPFIVSFHGYDYSITPREGGRHVYAKLFATADLITANSEFARSIIESLGCPPEKIEMLNYGLDLSEFPFRERTIKPDEPVRILSVGRLVEKKGFEFALRAVAKVREKHADLRYQIIGDGPLKNSLHALTNNLGIADIVEFLGSRDIAFIQRTMADTHIFLLPSVTASDGDQEGTPVSLLDAQAMGLPIVSTLHAGIPEIVGDQQSGLLVPEKDLPRLVDVLTFLIEHPEKWPAFGRAGRERIEKYHTAAENVRDLVKIYEKSSNRDRQ